MYKQTFVFMVLLVTINLKVFTQDNGGGQAGAFLRRGLDGKALALGGAFSSISDGASSVYWNPAGLNDIQKFDINISNSFLSLDRSQMFGAMGYSLNRRLSIGLGILKFGVNEIEGRDNNGNLTKNFNDQEIEFLASFAYKIINKRSFKVSTGLTIKYLSQSLYDNNANGFGFDMGATATFFEQLRVAFVLQDLYSILKWNTERETKETVPSVIKTGISYFPSFLASSPVIIGLSVEFIKLKNVDPKFVMGCGFTIYKLLVVRIGHDGSSICGGISLLSEYFKDNLIQIDYAATKDPFSNDLNHHVGISFSMF